MTYPHTLQTKDKKIHRLIVLLFFFSSLFRFYFVRIVFISARFGFNSISFAHAQIKLVKRGEFRRKETKIDTVGRMSTKIYSRIVKSQTPIISRLIACERFLSYRLASPHCRSPLIFVNHSLCAYCISILHIHFVAKQLIRISNCLSFVLPLIFPWRKSLMAIIR